MQQTFPDDGISGCCSLMKEGILPLVQHKERRNKAHSPASEERFSICFCCTEVKESWACSWAVCRSHTQTSAQSPEIKRSSSPTQLGALGTGLSEAPLRVTHTHTTGFQVFDTPPLSPSHRQLNNRKQIVHWIKCQHDQSSVSKHNPSHFYQASIEEIITGDVEPHWSE